MSMAGTVPGNTGLGSVSPASWATLGTGSVSGALAGAGAGAAIGGALAGAAMGSVVPGIGTAIGAVVGLVLGSVPALLSMQGGSGHAERMSKWNGALTAAADDANLPEAPALLSAAMAQLIQFQSLSAQVSTIPQLPASIATALAAATSANDALGTAGDKLASDVQEYTQFGNQINPWQPDNAPAQALNSIKGDEAAVTSALASAQASTQSLAQALGAPAPASSPVSGDIQSLQQSLLRSGLSGHGGGW